LNEESKSDIQWWISNLPTCEKKPVNSTKPDTVIFTDSSKEGWGSVMNDLATGGQWDERVRTNHIN
jgi:hypothetical protein